MCRHMPVATGPVPTSRRVDLARAFGDAASVRLCGGKNSTETSPALRSAGPQSGQPSWRRQPPPALAQAHSTAQKGRRRIGESKVLPGQPPVEVRPRRVAIRNSGRQCRRATCKIAAMDRIAPAARKCATTSSRSSRTPERTSRLALCVAFAPHSMAV
jgi:hypothetical protein